MKKIYLSIIVTLFIASNNLHSQNQNTSPDSIINLLVGSWDHISSCGYGCCGYYCSYKADSLNPTKYYKFSKVNGSLNDINYELYNDTLTSTGQITLNYSSTVWGPKWNLSLPGFESQVQRIEFPITDTLYLDNNCVDCSGNKLVKRAINCISNYTTDFDTVQNTFTLTVDAATIANAASYYWDFGDGSSSTLATPTHSYTKDTVYNVCLKIKTGSNDSCTYCHTIGKDTSGNIYRTTGFSLKVVNANTITNISPSIPNENSFTVFPNPSNGETAIMFDHSVNNIAIKVYDLTGQKVFENTGISGNRFNIDIVDQAAGIYFLEIIENGNASRQKLVKQ